MEDQNLTREELLEALAKSQAQVNILQKALLEDSKLAKQSRYEEIIQGLTDLVTRWLPDTTATYVNETYCEYFGLSMEQVLGNPFLPNLPEETQRIVKDAIQKMVSGEVESVTTEEESIDADGNHHWIQWTYSPIRDANGEIFEFQSVGRDITDLRQARAELERATAVVNQSPVVMFRRLMVDGRPQDTEYISENVRRYGYHPEDFYSGKMSLDDVIHPDHKIRVGTLLAKHIKDHTDEFEMELLTLSPDNREVWFALQGTFERDENDVPLVHQGVLIDITERKQGEFAREMGMAQTQSLYKMSAKMSMANGLDEILTAVTESVSPVNLNRSYLLDINVDEANKLETVRIIANWGAEGEEQLFPVGTVFPAQLHASFEMFLQREPFMIGDMTTDERLDAATRQILTGNGMRSAVVLSLFDGQKLFGGILMESRDVFEFTGDERQALGMISTQLSSAVQNELLLQTTNARAQALETVAEVATAVTAAQEDPQAVLKQVVDLTKERFGLYHAHVYQMNSAGDTLELVSGAGKIGDQMVAEKRSIPFAAEQSLVARAARSKEGVIVNDVTAAPNFLPHPLLPETKAELAVPMLAGDEVVGVLDVQASGMRRFDQDDVDVLTTLASQAAVALQNAEQYELIQQANEVIEASPVIIYRRKVVDNMLDEILYVSENVSQYGYSAEDLTSGRVPFEQTVYPDDLQFVGETLIGNLQNNIDEYEFEYRGIFPGDRVVWFTLRAKVERDENGEAVLQSGTIIDITDIKKADQEREAALSQTQKLFDVSKKLNEAGDLQEVLTAIVESIESVEFDRAMLVVHDLNKEDYKKIDALNFLATWAGTEEAQAVPLGMKMPAAEFPAVNLMEKREIHLIDNYQTDERFDEALKNWLAEQGVQSGLLMPLFDGDKPLAGVIVESVNTANFSEDEQQLMELVAAQATPVVQNVLQYEEVRRSEELTRSMYQTSQKLNAAGDLQEVLTAVVESIESVEFDRAMLVSHDLNREDYKKIDALNFLATWAGTENAQVVPVGMVMPASEFPAVNLMEKQEIHLINDYQTDERFDDALKKWLSDQGVKSGLLMPLFDGDKPLAGVILESTKQSNFTENEQSLMELVASQVTPVVQNVLLLEASEERAKALATVADVSTEVTGIQDPQEALKQVVDLTKERFGFYHAHVYQLNEAGDTLELVSGAGEIGDQMVAEGRSIALAAKQSLVARAARGKQGVIVNDVTSDPNFLPHPLLPDTNAELAVPMLAGAEVLGVLDVQASGMRRFDQDDVDVLTTLASQAAVALQNAQYFAERGLLLDQTQKLFDISRKLNEAGDLQEVLLAIAGSIESVEFDRASMLSIDTNEAKEIEALHILANWGRTEDVQVVPVGMTMPAEVFPAIGIFKIPDISLVNDYETDERFDEATRQWLAESGMYSGLFIPVYDGDKPIAGIVLESTRTANFTENEKHLMELAATQLTAVVQNDFLLKATAERAQALATVAEVSNAVTAAQDDPQAVLKQMVDLTKERFGLYHAHVYQMNDVGDTLNLVSGAGEIGDQMVAEGRSIAFSAEQSLVARAARGKQGVIVNDVTSDPNFLPHPLLPETKAELAVPMLAGDEVLGVLDVQASGMRRFDQDDVDVLTTLASQAAVALQNAEQYAVIQQANEVVLQSPVILYRRKVVDNMLDRILYVSENVAQYGYIAEDFTSGRVPFEQTIHPDDLQMVGETLIGNLQKKIDEYEFEYRSLFPGDRLVWFSLQTNVERDEEGVAVIQSGTFIDITDRKLAEVEREAALAQTQKLFDVSKKLNAAGDLQEVLTAIVESIESVEFDRAMLVSHNLNREDYKKIDALNFIATWAGSENAQVVPVGMVMPASGFPAVNLMEKREIHLIDDYQTDERFDDALKKWLSDQGVKSGLLMPLFDGDKPLAGVIVESTKQSNFTKDDQSLMELVASQVTPVVQNVLLLEATEERAKALATVADVSTEVTGIQDPQEALKQVVDLTKERFAFYHAHVYQMNQAGDTLQLVSGAGEIGDQMVAERRSIPLAAEQSLVARAARTREGVTVNDVTADPNFLPHPLLPDTKAELAVPMIAGDEVLGVLDVQADTAFRFTQDDIDVLTMLASQVSATLQNAQYYTERGELLAQTQKLFDISRKLNAAGDLQEVLLAIAGSIESVEFDRASMLSIDTNEAKGIEALHILANWGRTEDVQVVPVGMTMPAEVFPAIGIFKTPDISLVNDYETDERFDEATRQWLAESGMYSGLFIPVYDGDKPIAGIVLESTRTANFTENEKRLMELAASQLISVIQTNLQYTEVRRSEELVRDIINATPDWIFVKDLEHRYVMANQGYGDSLHIAPEDFIGKNDIELGFPEELVKGDPERGIRGFWADDDQVFETKEALLIERDIVQVDGKERIYSTLKTPLTDAAGNVSSVLIFARDVTEREDLLQETRSRAEQEALINTISQKIQSTTSVESALQVAIRELGDSLGAEKTSIRLGVDAGQRKRNK